LAAKAIKKVIHKNFASSGAKSRASNVKKFVVPNLEKQYKILKNINMDPNKV
jgi:hypothetical protein